MRINKFLASKGCCSRRAADEFITIGAVRINGKPAKAGDQVQDGDEVKFKDQSFRYSSKNSEVKIYLAFNKPSGIECSCDENIPNNIISYIKNHTDLEKQLKDHGQELSRVFNIGRLDKDSRGLILLTNDGELTQKLTHPSYEHEKEYEVKVNDYIVDEFIEDLATGVDIKIEDEWHTTLNCPVKKITNRKFRITLKQGLNRQIRRMVGVLGYRVEDLYRIRVANLSIKQLKLQEGQVALITPEQL